MYTEFKKKTFYEALSKWIYIFHNNFIRIRMLRRRMMKPGTIFNVLSVQGEMLITSFSNNYFPNLLFFFPDLPPCNLWNFVASF